MLLARADKEILSPLFRITVPHRGFRMALLCWGVMAVAVIVGARRSAEVVVVIVVATAGSPFGIVILVPIIAVAAVLDVA